MKLQYIGKTIKYDCDNGIIKTLTNGKIYNTVTVPFVGTNFLFVICDEGKRIGIAENNKDFLKVN